MALCSERFFEEGYLSVKFKLLENRVDFFRCFVRRRTSTNTCVDRVAFILRATGDLVIADLNATPRRTVPLHLLTTLILSDEEIAPPAYIAQQQQQQLQQRSTVPSSSHLLLKSPLGAGLHRPTSVPYPYHHHGGGSPLPSSAAAAAPYTVESVTLLFESSACEHDVQLLFDVPPPLPTHAGGGASSSHLHSSSSSSPQGELPIGSMKRLLHVIRNYAPHVSILRGDPKVLALNLGRRPTGNAQKDGASGGDWDSPAPAVVEGSSADPSPYHPGNDVDDLSSSPLRDRLRSIAAQQPATSPVAKMPMAALDHDERNGIFPRADDDATYGDTGIDRFDGPTVAVGGDEAGVNIDVRTRGVEPVAKFGIAPDPVPEWAIDEGDPDQQSHAPDPASDIAPADDITHLLERGERVFREILGIYGQKDPSGLMGTTAQHQASQGSLPGFGSMRRAGGPQGGFNSSVASDATVLRFPQQQQQQQQRSDDGGGEKRLSVTLRRLRHRRGMMQMQNLLMQGEIQSLQQVLDQLRRGALNPQLGLTIPIASPSSTSSSSAAPGHHPPSLRFDVEWQLPSSSHNPAHHDDFVLPMSKTATGRPAVVLERPIAATHEYHRTINLAVVVSGICRRQRQLLLHTSFEQNVQELKRRQVTDEFTYSN